MDGGFRVGSLLSALYSLQGQQKLGLAGTERLTLRAYQLMRVHASDSGPRSFKQEQTVAQAPGTQCLPEIISMAITHLRWTSSRSGWNLLLQYLQGILSGST